MQETTESYLLYSVLPKIIGQGSVLFGVEALAYLRGHWGVYAVRTHIRIYITFSLITTCLILSRFGCL